MQQMDSVILPNMRCHGAEINGQSCHLDCMEAVAGICLAVKYRTGENKINHVSKTFNKIRMWTHFSQEGYQEPELNSTLSLVRFPKPWLALSGQVSWIAWRAGSSLGTNNRNVFPTVGLGKQWEAAHEEQVLSNYQNRSLCANCLTWHTRGTHLFQATPSYYIIAVHPIQEKKWPEIWIQLWTAPSSNMFQFCW